MQESFLPVLLGGDLNCYSMARAFYEACGIPSLVLGKEKLGIVRHSRYLTFRAVPKLGENVFFLPNASRACRRDAWKAAVASCLYR